MDDGDFFSSEQSHTMAAAGTVRIEHVAADGSTTVMKAETDLQAGEVIDSSRMSVDKLKAFYEKEIQDAHDNDVMLSLHLKATMMKVRVRGVFREALSRVCARVCGCCSIPHIQYQPCSRALVSTIHP